MFHVIFVTSGLYFVSALAMDCPLTKRGSDKSLSSGILTCVTPRLPLGILLC